MANKELCFLRKEGYIESGRRVKKQGFMSDVYTNKIEAVTKI
jgi:hypothetical protein